MIPIWLHIPSVPNETFLASIAAAAGTPLIKAAETQELIQRSSARYRVMADCSSRPPNGIWVDLLGFSYWQRLNYGVVPAWCNICHYSSSCNAINQEEISCLSLASEGEPGCSQGVP